MAWHTARSSMCSLHGASVKSGQVCALPAEPLLKWKVRTGCLLDATPAESDPHCATQGAPMAATRRSYLSRPTTVYTLGHSRQGNGEVHVPLHSLVSALSTAGSRRYARHSGAAEVATRSASGANQRARSPPSLLSGSSTKPSYSTNCEFDKPGCPSLHEALLASSNSSKHMRPRAPRDSMLRT